MGNPFVWNRQEKSPRPVLRWGLLAAGSVSATVPSRRLFKADDITQQRKLESQLFQSEKTASIGQLAAGVAHEINNPVGFVNSNLNTLKDYQQDLEKLITRYREALNEAGQLSLKSCDGLLAQKIGTVDAFEHEIELDFPLEDGRQLIEECQEGTNRIKNIMQDLKSFVHPGEESRQLTDINQCIESTLNIVWNELEYNAKVIKEFEPLPLTAISRSLS